MIVLDEQLADPRIIRSIEKSRIVTYVIID